MNVRTLISRCIDKDDSPNSRPAGSGLVAMLALVVAVHALECTAQQDSPGFPEVYNSEREPGEPISPEEALSRLRLPAGFNATVFAAEPMVRNPIAACTDALGRVWVAENYTYAERAQRFDLSLSDRIVVLEDEDGDGMAEKRTVFADDLKVLTGIAVGRGGVWLMCPPQLLFIPDQNEDLVPDGRAQVKLDGFKNASENYHNFANGLSWGPDGWLYGRCGASCPGEMGLPGSTDEQRVPIRGGLWRFHPERGAVEALVQGTTNPWGHDWNELGELFFINTVNGHFWHCIPGAHFDRPHTLDVNPNSYELIAMHADHWHFDTGKGWTASRAGAANDYGGGHAHIGLMIYQELAWPAEYRGSVMTVNMHGRRVNQERLQPQGSGYVATHGDDFLLSEDEWFRGMDLLPLHDGNVLLLDWSDTGECHEQTGVHRTSGRIFKIRYGDHSTPENPLADAMVRGDPLRLAQIQETGATWHARRARECMVASSGDPGPATQFLTAMLFDLQRSPVQRLRALWSLIALNAIDGAMIDRLLSDKEAALRSWGVRLLSDDWRLDTVYGNRPWDEGGVVEADAVARLVELAQSEPEASVRLALATVLQRLPADRRLELAIALASHEQDADDHNLPLMVWYGLSALGDDHPKMLLDVLESCRWPVTRKLISRRIAEQLRTQPEWFERMFEMALSKDEAFQADIILGTARALAGWRQAAMPKAWTKIAGGFANDDPQLTAAIRNLSILFGDGRTVEDLIRVVEDEAVSLELRKAALQTLVDSRASGTKELCLKLLNQRFLNSVAAAGLAREADPGVGDAIVQAYKRFHPSERSQAISILTSRNEWAKSLLSAVEQGQVDRADISAFQARQMASLSDPELEKMLLETWGQVRATSEEKRAKIEALRSEMSGDSLAEASRSAGRSLFQKSCASCHQLFGEGGRLGPDLTGAQRNNLDYLLENVVDPSAVVTKEFRATIILLDDQRVLTGLVTEKSDGAVTLATQNEVFHIPTEEIVQIRQSNQSTMPDGLLDQLSQQQVKDLFAYLQSAEQVSPE